MAIKIDCPRCKKPLSVPHKKIGRYVSCPRCGGRFWVPENAAVDSSWAGSDLPPAGPALQPPLPPEKLPATLTMGGAATLPPGGVVREPPMRQNTAGAQDPPLPPPVEGGGSPWQIVPPPAPAAGPPRTVQPPGSARKTARFVSAAAAESPLKLEEDGKLPELHLLEGGQKQKKETKTTSVNPLVLFGLLAISVALSIGLALVEIGLPKSQKKDDARREIEASFFPRADEEPLEHHEYLMMAQRANTRGDRQAERKAYEKVLELLRQERPAYAGDDDQGWSLTHDDERLKHLISVLLSND